SAITALLAGCETIRYELRPPATQTGRLCVAQCANTREVCRSNELHRAEAAQRDCERDSERDYHACHHRADSPETHKDCDKRKRYCSTYTNYDGCEADYRGCYAQCGGTVTKIVEKY
ncbi:MAG TPA: hypothetical protein VMT89_17325, partial [Candidatus Acidoferrales bacterium]|nr:hypothetical protein [Candidatus Acidoferrales bacterium]